MQNKTENEALPALTFNTKTTHVSLSTKQSIVCIKCSETYEFPKQRDDYLAHLFLEHRLVIADVNEIALLEDYLKYWVNEFKSKQLEEYCTTLLLDQQPDGTPAKNEKYFLLSDILPKDFELRKQLKQQRLEQALERHQFERTDRTFSKECLYCRDVITGLRADFIAHLFSKHFLLLGKPKHLVYVDELLEKVQSNMEQLICLYCEKVFKDRPTLKEHMRKKGHKRINPDNRDYDKYFLVNYRNETKPKPKKLHRQPKSTATPSNRAEDKADSPTRPSHLSDKEDSVDFEQRYEQESDSDWSDWDGDASMPLTCLFCSCQEQEFSNLKTHMRQEHKLEFDAGIKNLNFYQKIKVVNYVRRQVCLQRCVTCNIRCDTKELLLQHMHDEMHFGLGTQKQWDKPEYFFPTYEDDGLLCILDDNPNDDLDDTVVRIISEDTMAQINKEAERLSLDGFKFSI